MNNADRSDTCSYRKISRLTNSRPAHFDGDSSTPDLCKRVWRVGNCYQGWKAQVLSGNLFYSSIPKGGS
jgi:hypothetical protein